MFKNIVVFTLILVGAFPVLAFAAYKLPDTGQQACYQTSPTYDPSLLVFRYDPIACATTEQDGGQDGAYNINPLSFTDNGNGTITDNNTGLMWQQNHQSNYNWYQAAGIYNADDNSSSLNACSLVNNGGYSDWRLPTLKELMSLLDLSGLNPNSTIDPLFSYEDQGRYWANTDNEKAQSVDFIFGLYFASEIYVPTPPNDPPYHARCVRGGQQNVRQKLVNALDGAVTDTSTGLMWAKTSPGFMNLGASLAYCQALNVGGNTGWRLPNIKELESWLDAARVLNTEFFPGFVMDQYWSSTTTYGHPDEALTIDIGFSTMSPNSKDRIEGTSSFPFEHYAQCVRSIPNVSDGDLNGDGQVTIIDVLLALRAVVELDAKTQFYFDHADVGPIVGGVPTTDGLITLADALAILQKAVGLVNW